jgi:protein phosphatase PTC1
MVVRFDKVALMETQKDKAIGVESDITDTSGKISEAEKIVSLTKQKIADGVPAVGVSGSNSGRGHDPVPLGDGEAFKPTTLKGPVDETPEDSDAPEITKEAIPDPGSYLTPASEK